MLVMAVLDVDGSSMMEDGMSWDDVYIPPRREEQRSLLVDVGRQRRRYRRWWTLQGHDNQESMLISSYLI